MKKISSKLNFIDYLIILLIIPVVVVLCGMYAQRNILADFDKSTKKVDLHIVFETTEFDKSFADSIKNGVQVADISSGELFGTVYDHIILSSDTSENDNALITIKCSAMDSGGYYTVNGRNLLLGDAYYLATPEFAFEGKCVSVDSIEK